MGIRRRAGKRKQNNTGSAIVTVLVVVTFITILATVLLYISGLNFQMKVTDYRTKESFYQAEIPAEELRAQLTKDVQVAFAKAYTAAMSEYAGLGDAATREANYRQQFCEELDKIWDARSDKISGTENRNWALGITKVVLEPATAWTPENDGTDSDAPASVYFRDLADGGYCKVEVATSTGWDTSRAVSDGQVILSGVTFTYDSPTHYSSIISTDYCITIPSINWGDYVPESTLTSGTSEESSYFSGCVSYMNWTKQ